MPEFLLIEIPLETKDGTKTPTQVVGGVVTPGLVITPELGYDVRLTGRWVLTHAESGRAVSGFDNGACLVCIREYAAFAIGTNIDWTQPHAAIADEVKTRATEGAFWQDALKQLRDCPGDCGSLALPFEF